LRESRSYTSVNEVLSIQEKPQMLAILQLGDIHVREGRANPVLERAQLIASAVRTLVAPASELYLIFAGDIAFSGKHAEYKLAEAFVRGLQQELKKLPPQYGGTATIPGNHDCNFDASPPSQASQRNSRPSNKMEKPQRSC
jgi:hypothetical protein